MIKTIARPNFLSENDRRIIAEELVAELRKNHGNNIPDTAVDDIVACAGRYLDGYQIAKILDNKYYWYCNFEISEDLNSWFSLYESKLNEREYEWASTIDFGDMLPPGTRVTAVWGGKRYAGAIKEIYAYGAAQYVVKLDDRNGGVAIINFEDVTPISDGEQS